MSPNTNVLSFARLVAFLLVLAIPLFAPSARAGQLLFQTYAQRDGLADDYINGVAFAPDGSAWVATPRGATRVQGRHWVNYTSANGLGNSWVAGVAVTSTGVVYLATNGGGLSELDGSTNKTLSLSSSDIPGNFLTAVAADAHGDVWVGTYGAGVARFDGSTWTKFTLQSSYVNAVALDEQGNPWIASDDGAYHLAAVSAAAPSNSAPFKPTVLAGQRVHAVAVAPDGRVWFATDAGAAVFDGKTIQSFDKAAGLADDEATAVAVGLQGRVWAGTKHGLSVLQAGVWNTYSRSDGLADDEITSLNVDSKNNVWVGTTHGLSIYGGLSLVHDSTLPVVLVHGWHTAESDQIDDTEFRFIEHYLQQDGFSVFYAAGISPHHTLLQNEATLRDDIASVRAQTGAPRVDIIAFSMGGLNTRSYLESTLYPDDVRRAIILGTPQAGVQLWYSLLTREIEDRPDEPSAIELTPEYAALFNHTHAPNPTVPYDLFVGDARSQPGLPLLKVFPPSDGLISAYSALALDGPLVRRELNTNVHAWDPSPLPFAITSYLYPDQTYLGYIRNALRDPDTQPLAPAAPPLAPVAPRNITPLNVDTLLADQSIAHTVAVDPNRAARFFAHWTGGDVDVTLRAPDGPRYTPDDFRSSTYLKANVASFSGYAIDAAPAGIWSVDVSRVDQGQEPITVTTYVDLDADLHLDAGTDHAWYPLGAPVVITATLSDPSPGAEVTASMEWLGDGVAPRSSPIVTRLLEQGAPGSYANTVANLVRGGYYLVRVTARAPAFTRERETLFSMSPQTAAFAGAAVEYAQGESGRYSALAVNTTVNAKRAGAFALSATLRDAQGAVVTSLTEPITLTVGVQPVSISVPGRDIRARAIDGPYTVDLTLMDAAWAAVQLDVAPQAVATRAYRANDFQ